MMKPARSVVRWVAVGMVLAVCASPCAAEGPRDYLSKPDAWFRSDEGRRIAENILSWQTSAGSWPKNLDTAVPCPPGKSKDGTFDNGATVSEMRFLAKAYQATRHPPYRDAFQKGFVHILKAQYPTGGWPQFYPAGPYYHHHITFNDYTMVNLMELLRWTSRLEDDDLVGPRAREAARQAFDRGVECILKCQIVVNGRKTVWCAQHDEKTLEPRGARSYELVSLSGGESVGILQLLMSIEEPSQAVADAIVAGAEWYRASEITDKTALRAMGVPGPGWARFYEIPTNRPIFSGRDGVKKFSLAAIEAERAEGYGWWGPYGDKVAREYAAWKKRHKDNPKIRIRERPKVVWNVSGWAEPEVEASHVMRRMCPVLKEIRAGDRTALAAVDVGYEAADTASAEYKTFRDLHVEAFRDAMITGDRPAKAVARQEEIEGRTYDRLLVEKGDNLASLMVGMKDGRCVAYWFMGDRACWSAFTQGLAEAAFTMPRGP